MSSSKPKAAAKAPTASTPSAQPGADPRGAQSTPADAKSSDDEDEPRPRSKRAEVADEQVTVRAPKPFKLNTDRGVVDYPAGIYEMPRSHAEHWYAAHHGVEIAE